MYEFATVALIGLAVAKLVDLVDYVGDVSRATKVTLAMLVGVGITWATDYSVFAGWNVAFRDGWMGPVGTGVVIGGMASALHELLDLVSSYARKQHDEANAIESHTPRAA